MTPLHHLGEFLRDLLALVPLPVVRGLFVALPFVILIWVLRLPPAETTRPGGVGRKVEDLRLWAALALLIQILIYTLI